MNIKEMELSEVKIVKGNVTCCLWLKVQIPGLKRKINATFDCISRNLVIHEWWLIEKDSRKAVHDMFFRWLKEIEDMCGISA